MLVDLTVNGEPRKALVTTGKLGIIEAIDRTNGQWLWHKETVPQNVVASIDPKTGVKTINAAAIPHIGQTTVNCPADPGSRGWPATAYSPKTGILYLPLNEYCSNTTPTPLDPGQAYTGGGRAVYARVPVPNSDGKIGRVDGVKLSDQSTAWSFRTRAPQTGAVLPTGGGVVFNGAWDRWFRAFDDTTGRGALADAPEQRHQLVPGHLHRQRQAICRGRRGQRLEPRALACDADARDQESGRRLGALGVRAAGLNGACVLGPSCSRRRQRWRLHGCVRFQNKTICGR